MEEVPDYYAILGVKEDATVEEIRKAYKKLALKYHPDRTSQQEQEDAHEMFSAINTAHEHLSDKEKREYYDYLRKQSRRAEHHRSEPSSQSRDPGAKSYNHSDDYYYHPKPEAFNQCDESASWYNYHSSYGGEPPEQSARPEHATKGDDGRGSPREYPRPSKKHTPVYNSEDDQVEYITVVRTKSRKHRSGKKQEESKSKGAKKEKSYIEEYDDYPSPVPSSSYEPRVGVVIPSLYKLQDDLNYYTGKLFAENHKIDMKYRWLEYCWKDYIDPRELELRNLAEQSLDLIADNIHIFECWCSCFHQQTSRASRMELWDAIPYAQEQLSEARAVTRAVRRAGQVQRDMATYRLDNKTDRVSVRLQREFVKEISMCRPLRLPPCQSQSSKGYTYRRPRLYTTS